MSTRLILAEEDNIKRVFASLATKVTSQSVIIGKLSSYARKNRTKKALWELDNVHRSLYLLNYTTPAAYAACSGMPRTATTSIWRIGSSGSAP